MTRFIRLGRDVWVLARGYWSSEERWSARALLATIVVLNLGMVFVNVKLNTANGAVFNALQVRNSAAFYKSFISIIELILVFLAVALLRYYLNQTLQIRWRRWLTQRYLGQWLARHTFYRMRFYGRVDNPDQRISEDINLFISQTMSLGLGLLSSCVTLASFAAILWRLSGSITLRIGGLDIVIDGYMFWVAVLYSAVGSGLAYLVGRPLIRLNNRQQRFEADFRFSMVRMREEAEGIALYGGEDQERGFALGRFAALYRNFRMLILRNTQYLTFEIIIGQLASFFPLLVASPRYFSGAIQLGPLMQTANAFGHVNGALSWFINSYTTFAEWRATVDRLVEFTGEIVRETDPNAQIPQFATGPATAPLEIDRLSVALPDGTALLDPATVSFEPRQAVLLRGPTGSGKSTLFRVLAGIWPFAHGQIRVPADSRRLFLPQRPYMPIGTLRAALWFPEPPAFERDAEARTALAAVGLPAMAARLDEEAYWGHRLSPGEQQRVAIARALLLKPDWLFLDEATSAMDEDQEAVLYGALATALPRTTIVTIGHRHSLEAYHSRVIAFERAPGSAGHLTEGVAV